MRSRYSAYVKNNWQCVAAEPSVLLPMLPFCVLTSWEAPLVSSCCVLVPSTLSNV